MLISILEWSLKMKEAGVAKSAQSKLLGSGDPNDIHRLLRQPDRLLVDQDTCELWRKVTRYSHRSEDDAENAE
jgi:hypothetical protein